MRERKMSSASVPRLVLLTLVSKRKNVGAQPQHYIWN